MVVADFLSLILLTQKSKVDLKIFVCQRYKILSNHWPHYFYRVNGFLPALDFWAFSNIPYKVEGRSVIELFIEEFLPNRDRQPLISNEQDPELLFQSLMGTVELNFIQPYLSTGIARGRCVCTEPMPISYDLPVRLPYIVVPFLNGNLQESIDSYFQTQETRTCPQCQVNYQIRITKKLMERPEFIPIKLERLTLDPRTTDDAHYPPIYRRDEIQLDDLYMVPDGNGDFIRFEIVSTGEHTGSENSGLWTSAFFTKISFISLHLMNISLSQLKIWGL